MESERWRQIEALYHAALERAEGERVAFLAEACHGDESLQRKEIRRSCRDHAVERGADHAGRQLAGALEEEMTLAAGTNFGPYEILSPLGAGGLPG